MNKEITLRFKIDGSQANASLQVAGESINELAQQLNLSESAAKELVSTLNAGLEQTVNTAQEAAAATNKVGSGGDIARFKNQATATKATLLSLNYTLRDAPFLFQNFNMGIMAISNNIGPLLDGLQELKRTSGSLKGALGTVTGALSGPAGLTIGLTLVVGAIQALSSWMSRSKKDLDAFGDSADKAKKSVAELEADLLNFTASAEQAKTIEIQLKKEKYQKELDAVVEDIKAKLKLINENAGVSPIAVGKMIKELDALQAREKQLKDVLAADTPEYTAYKEQIESITLAGKAMTNEYLDKFITANGVSNNAIQVTLRSMRQELNALTLGSEKYKEQAAAIENLEKVRKRLAGSEQAPDQEALKRQKLVNALQLELIADGKAKELAELKLWYAEKKKVAGSDYNALAVLDAAYAARKKEINKKAKDKETELAVKYKAAQWELLEAELRAEGAADSAILQAKRKFLREKLALYKHNTQQREALEHDLKLNQIAINDALDTEAGEQSDKQQQTRAIEFQNSIKIARMQGASEVEIARQITAEKKAELERVKVAEYASFEDRNLAITRANSDYLDAQSQLADAEIEQRQRVKEAALQFGREAWAALSDLAQQFADQQAQNDIKAIERETKKRKEALKTEREKQLAAAYTLTEQTRINRKFDSEEQRLEQEAEARKKQAQLKAFRVQQDISYTNTVMNTAEAVVATFSEFGWPAGIIPALIMGGIGMAQLALISSQQPPALASGGLFIGNGGPTEDANLVRLSNREFVVNNQMTEKHFSLVDDVNSDRVYYGGDGIIQELRALRTENRDMRRELGRVSRRPVRADVGIKKYETGSIVQYGEYEVQKGRLEAV